MEVCAPHRRGRLSELFGKSTLDQDRFIRTLGWREAAERDLAAMLRRPRAALDAYADGVNAWITEPPGRLSTAVRRRRLPERARRRRRLRRSSRGRRSTPRRGRRSRPGSSAATSTPRSSGCSPTRGSATRRGPTSCSRRTTRRCPSSRPSGLGSAARGRRRRAAQPRSAAERPRRATRRDLAAPGRRAGATSPRPAAGSSTLAGLDGGDGLAGDHQVGSNNWVVAAELSADRRARCSPTTRTSGSRCRRSGS